MFDTSRTQAQPMKLPLCVVDSDYYERVRYRHFQQFHHYWLCARMDARLMNTGRPPLLTNPLNSEAYLWP